MTQLDTAIEVEALDHVYGVDDMFMTESVTLMTKLCVAEKCWNIKTSFSV